MKARLLAQFNALPIWGRWLIGGVLAAPLLVGLLVYAILMIPCGLGTALILAILGDKTPRGDVD